MVAEPDTFFRYFSINRRDLDWGLQVTCAGYVKMPPGTAYPPAGHPARYDFVWEQGRVLGEFQLHYIARGRGVFESERGGKRTIESGSVFLLFPGEWHRYRSDQQVGWHEYWVGFKGEEAQRFLRKGFLSPGKPVFGPRGDDVVLEQFTGMMSEMRLERPGFRQMIAASTSLLVATIRAAECARRETATRAEAIIRRAKSILRKSLQGGPSLASLSKELGVSSAWLRLHFRKHTGLPVRQYQIHVRLEAAIHRLETCDESIKVIAAECGFPDGHYFSRVFKKVKGCTATVWRERRLRIKRK